MSTAANAPRAARGTRVGTQHAAGAFDVRNVIAALIGFYGVVLVVVGLVDNATRHWRRPAGSTPTCGSASRMLVFALSFALWSRLRPIVVDAGEGRGTTRADDGAA